MLEVALKARLIDFLFPLLKQGEILALEVPFADFRRRADVIKIGKTLTSYEIKGPLDNLAKLDAQAIDYRNCFNESFVVVADSGLREIRRWSGKHFGLVVIPTEGLVRQVRKPKVRKILSRQCLSSFLRRDELLNLMPKNQRARFGRDIPTELLRNMLAKHASQKVIQGAAAKSLFDRYAEGFRHFEIGRGRITLEDELQLLTQPS